MGRQIGKIFIDEQDYITEEQWDNLSKKCRGSIFRHVSDWFKRLVGIRTDRYYLGADFAKDEMTTCSTRMGKDGIVYVEEIKTTKLK